LVREILPALKGPRWRQSPELIRDAQKDLKTAARFISNLFLLRQARRGKFQEKKGGAVHEKDQCNHSSFGNRRRSCLWVPEEGRGAEASRAFDDDLNRNLDRNIDDADGNAGKEVIRRNLDVRSLPEATGGLFY
jgi:hypothetical protein